MTNIIGCAYVNALATHLPGIVLRTSAKAQDTKATGGELVHTPPAFVREFAGRLLQFLF
jgi:hypothetical protein